MAINLDIFNWIKTNTFIKMAVASISLSTVQITSFFFSQLTWISWFFELLLDYNYKYLKQTQNAWLTFKHILQSVVIKEYTCIFSFQLFFMSYSQLLYCDGIILNTS